MLLYNENEFQVWVPLTSTDLQGLISMVQLRPKFTIRRPIRTSIYTLVLINHFKRGVVKTLLPYFYTIMSDERDKVEDMSHVKQALTLL